MEETTEDGGRGIGTKTVKQPALIFILDACMLDPTNPTSTTCTWTRPNSRNRPKDKPSNYPRRIEIQTGARQGTGGEGI
jgi:hypothetical protein